MQRPESAHPPATAIEAPEQHITHDLPCPGCGYNLRGLAKRQACPECGRAMPDADWLRPINLSNRRVVRRLRTGFILGAASMIAGLASTPFAAVGAATGSRLLGAAYLWIAPVLLLPASVWLLTPVMSGPGHSPVTERTRWVARGLALGTSACAAAGLLAWAVDSVTGLAFAGLGFNLCAAGLMGPMSDHTVAIARSVPRDILAYRAASLLGNMRFIFGLLFVLNVAFAPVALWNNWSPPEVVFVFVVGAMGVLMILVLAVALASAAALSIAFERALTPLLRAGD